MIFDILFATMMSSACYFLIRVVICEIVRDGI